MTIEFHASKDPTLGVEIELQILNPETRKLEPRSDHLIERCRQRKIERVKAEIHQSMLEIDSEISADVHECAGYLTKRLQQLSAVARELGVEVAMGGTHPFEHWRDSRVYPSERYLNVTDKYQWLAKRVTVYGMHVHVGVPSGDAAIAVMNGAVPYLPQLLALSANSPFWQGVDTGLQSCRIGVMDSFPYSGIPKQFSSWRSYEQYCEVLMNTGSIESMKDIYWHVRPNASFGTIEFRICDTLSTLDEAMAVTAFIQCLVVWLMEMAEQNGGNNLYDESVYWVAPENQWIAARDGFSGSIIPQSGVGRRVKISDAILESVQRFQPVAKRLGCLEELARIPDMVACGNGAHRQRSVRDKTQSLEAVVDALIYEFHSNKPQEFDRNGDLIIRENYVPVF